MSIANLRLVPDVQIAGLHKHPNGLEVFIFGGDDDDETLTHSPANELDLGESWAQLDQLLGDGAFIANGGRTIGQLDEGPARSFSSTEVAALSKQLASLSDGEIKKRARQMPPEVLETLAHLKAFVTAGAAKKLGMVAYLS